VTTALVIITRALREIRVLGGQATASGMLAANTLEALNNVIDHMEGYGCAHPWLPRRLSTSVAIHRDDMGAQVQADTSGGAFTLTLPQEPRDGARLHIIDAGGVFNTQPLTVDAKGLLFDADLDANGMPTGGSRAATVLNTAGLNRRWMYRADLAAWVQLERLTITAQSPFPVDMDRSLIDILAMEVVGDYGLQPSVKVITGAQHGFHRFAHRYVPDLPAAIDNALLRGNGYVTGDYSARPTFWS
jgi:hypothetical protein